MSDQNQQTTRTQPDGSSKTSRRVISRAGLGSAMPTSKLLEVAQQTQTYDPNRDQLAVTVAQLHSITPEQAAADLEEYGLI